MGHFASDPELWWWALLMRLEFHGKLFSTLINWEQEKRHEKKKKTFSCHATLIEKNIFSQLTTINIGNMNFRKIAFTSTDSYCMHRIVNIVRRKFSTNADIVHGVWSQTTNNRLFGRWIRWWIKWPLSFRFIFSFIIIVNDITSNWWMQDCFPKNMNSRVIDAYDVYVTRRGI